jgi:chromosome segregation ATPase
VLVQDYYSSEKAAAAAVAKELAACQAGSQKLQAALHAAHDQIQALSADSQSFQGSLQERAALQGRIHQLELQLDEVSNGLEALSRLHQLIGRAPVPIP